MIFFFWNVPTMPVYGLTTKGLLITNERNNWKVLSTCRNSIYSLVQFGIFGIFLICCNIWSWMQHIYYILVTDEAFFVAYFMICGDKHNESFLGFYVYTLEYKITMNNSLIFSPRSLHHCNTWLYHRTQFLPSPSRYRRGAVLPFN